MIPQCFPNTEVKAPTEQAAIVYFQIPPELPGSDGNYLVLEKELLYYLGICS